jgi:hypothetical protein
MKRFKRFLPFCIYLIWLKHIIADGFGFITHGETRKRESDLSKKFETVNINSLNGNREVHPHYDRDIALTAADVGVTFTLDSNEMSSIGKPVCSAGDINGDGFEDIAIGDPTYNSNTGRVLVVFGCRNLTGNVALPSYLTNLFAGAGGFVVDGASAGDSAGTAVAAGYSNISPFADLIVSSPHAASNSGKVYYIYGNGSCDNYGLTSFTSSKGFIIYGESNSLIGSSISFGGDFNSDRMNDFIISSSQYVANTGVVYLIFGGNNINIDLSALPLSKGIKVVGSAVNSWTGFSISGSGDVNNDGYADLLVGAPAAASAGLKGNGKAYLIYGNRIAANYDLSVISTSVVTFSGSTSDIYLGSAACVGDVNNDGFFDLIISAPHVSSTVSIVRNGAVFILFGKTSPFVDMILGPNVELTAGTGVILYGETSYFRLGVVISVGKSIKGGDYNDILIGGANQTIVYLMYGSPFLSTSSITLRPALPSAVGMVLSGSSVGYGASLDIGDFNGDGLGDIFIGSPRYSPRGQIQLIFGQEPLPTSQPTSQPSRQPSSQPTQSPTIQPSVHIQASNLRDGLIVYFPFDGNANDKSGNGINGIIRGGTSFVSDRSGNPSSAIYLNGNNYVELPGLPFNFYTSFCVSFWIWAERVQLISANIFDKGNGLSSLDGWAIAINGDHDNKIRFLSTTATGNKVITNDLVYSLEVWTHVVLTWDATGYVFYRNGVSLQLGAFPTGSVIKSNGNLPLLIGAQNGGHSNPASAVGNYFKGMIDDIFIYNRSLSSSEVQELYSFQRPTSQPTGQPSSQPSCQPVTRPTGQPSSQPIGRPTTQPTRQPSSQPSGQPSSQPSGQPVPRPTGQPSSQPISRPTAQPTSPPSEQPSSQPTVQPSSQPSGQPITRPSSQPSEQPSGQPSTQPVSRPTAQPTSPPSEQPSSQPTGRPSSQPSGQPITRPSSQPSERPSGQPSTQPASRPTAQPTSPPSEQPSSQPTGRPSSQPSGQPITRPSSRPSEQPSAQPSTQPVSRPTAQPTSPPSEQPSSQPTGRPSSRPSGQPITRPSSQPSEQPSAQPSSQPTGRPSSQPSGQPITRPSSRPSEQPSVQPSTRPVSRPTAQPTSPPSQQPNSQPTGRPSSQPSGQPITRPSSQPSGRPVSPPTVLPTFRPSPPPSFQPAGQPSSQLSGQPISRPSSRPSEQPSVQPSTQPVSRPTAQPTSPPSLQANSQPTGRPSSQRLDQPFSYPTVRLVSLPTHRPSFLPTGQPSVPLLSQPTLKPSVSTTTHHTSPPSYSPSSLPSDEPSSYPSLRPILFPSSQPISGHSNQPTPYPSLQPTSSLAPDPTEQPSSVPTDKPVSLPSLPPITEPIFRLRPSVQPTTRPVVQSPSIQPASQPTSVPSVRPSSQAISQPSMQPNSFVSQPFSPSQIPAQSGVPFGALPSSQPTTEPFVRHDFIPSSAPSLLPSVLSSAVQQSSLPSSAPFHWLTNTPTALPPCRTVVPSSLPTSQPTLTPTCLSKLEGKSPSTLPSPVSTEISTLRPSSDSPVVPSFAANGFHTDAPSGITTLPTSSPTPSAFSLFRNPSCLPTSHPTAISPDAVPLFVPAGLSSGSPSSRPSFLTMADPSGKPSPHAGFDPTLRPPFPVSDPSSVPSVDYFSPPRLLQLVISDVSRLSLTITGSLSNDGILYGALFPPSTQVTTVYQVVDRSVSSEIIDGTAVLKFLHLIPSTEYVVYFVAKSRNGNLMAFNDVLLTKLLVTTACCREVAPLLKSNIMFANQGYLNLITVSVDYRPSSYLLLRMVLKNAESELPVAHSPFFPSLVNFTSTTVSSTSFFTGLPEGNYSLQLLLEGVDSGKFLMRNNVSIFNLVIVNEFNPLPAPVLHQAIFANDGSHVIISFSSPALIANISGSFLCEDVFVFHCAREEGVSVGGCRWSDDSYQTVNAYITGSAACIKVGDQVKVREDVVIRALCPRETCGGYESWPVLDSTTVVNLLPPLVPVGPTVVLSIPPRLPWSNCSSLLLDLTNSIGNAGRTWSNISITVKSEPITTGLVILQSFVERNKYRISPPLEIPMVYLVSGTKYDFIVELCNFFGMCSQTSNEVSITSENFPVVRIVGSRSLTMKRSQPLLLMTTLLSTSNCHENFGKLQYNWTISKITSFNQSLVEFSIRSQSKDVSRFSVPYYSLQANSIYQVRLTTYSLSFPALSSTAEVEVTVGSGNIISRIKGNAEQNMRAGEGLLLDASNSYDEDQGETIPSRLSFGWMCVQAKPSFNASCNHIFHHFASQTSSTLKLVSLESAGNVVVQITVRVVDPVTQRTSTASVTVSIYEKLSATISLLSNLGNGNIANQGSNIQISATLSIPANVQGNASWSLSSGNSLDLSNVAATALSRSVFSSSNLQSLRMNLVLPPNSLKTGNSYTFALTCALSFPGITTSSMISIIINSAPMPGSFRVSPGTGYSLIDPFMFSCSNWISDYLPLSYQFGYISQMEIKLVIRSSSVIPFTSSILPTGSIRNNHTVLCLVDVFDSLNANRTLSFPVTVISTENLIFTQRTSGAVTKKIDANLNTTLALLLSNVDDIARGTAIASFILNQANCSHAPNCTALNRLPCYSKAHTCGSCLSSSLIGSLGESNDACYDTSKLKVPKPPSLKLKSCAGNCSSHGLCKYSSLLTGKMILGCYEGDLSCKTYCSCFPGYQKSENCELSDVEIQEKMKLREQVIDGIVAYVNHQDVSEQNIVSWINSINEITQSPNELSPKSTNSILQLTNYALSTARDKGYNSYGLTGVASSIDAVASSVVNQKGNQGRKGRRLSGGDSSDLVGAEDLLTSLKGYSSLIVSEMVAGQQAKTITQKNFRFYTENRMDTSSDTSSSSHRKLSEYDALLNLTIKLPVSPLESHIGYIPSSVKIPFSSAVSRLQSNETSDNMKIAVISLSSSIYGDDRDYRSDSTSVHLSSVPCFKLSSGEYSCRLELVLHSNNQGIGEISENITSFYCADGDTKNHSVFCSSNQQNYTVQCHGKEETIQVHCPTVTVIPTCQGLFSDELSTDIGCDTIAYTQESVTCSCPFFASSVRNRKLLALSSLSANDSHPTVDINYISLLHNVEGNFKSNILSAANLNDSTVKKSWDVILTLGLLLGAVIAAMYYSYKHDKKVQSKVSFENRVTYHSKSITQKRTVESGKEGERSGLPSSPKSAVYIDFDELARQSLPQILSSTSARRTFREKLWIEIKRHHRWFGVIFHYSPAFPRILRVVSLSTNIIIMLFIQSLTYGLTEGDDGTCEQYHNEAACLKPGSPYQTGGTKCYWTLNTTGGSSTAGYCSFIHPESSIKVVIFVAILSALITTPLAILTDWIILHILAAPTLDNEDEDFSFNETKKSRKAKILSIFPAGSGKALISSSTEESKRDQRSHSEVRRSSMERHAKFDKIISKELKQLKEEIVHYRAKLEMEYEREEFDCEFVIFLSFLLLFLPLLLRLFLLFCRFCSIVVS